MQFSKKMFANAQEIAKIANVFFRERFPIYGIQSDNHKIDNFTA